MLPGARILVCLVLLMITRDLPGAAVRPGPGNVVLKRFPVKASQGVAVDEQYFYAISNTAITKCDKNTGAVTATWRADPNDEAMNHLTHLNSAVVVTGKLYCAHSRYPADPNDNSIEIFDVQGERLAHERTIHLPRRHGSLTWADRHPDGSWWVCYAVYGREKNKDTTLVKCRWIDDGWVELRTWRFPPQAIAQWGSASCSGGSWGPDGNLYTTGHDDAKTHVLALDPAGNLTYVRTEAGVGFYGQAIAWDRFSDPPVLWGIVKGKEVSATFISRGDTTGAPSTFGAVHEIGSRDATSNGGEQAPAVADVVRTGTRTVRPRVVILSDFPPVDVIPGGAGYGPAEKRSDPDDVQSMVRLLLYSNDLEIQGLVASAATLANVADKRGLLDLLDLYDRVDENLPRHDDRYPTADQLRRVTWQGRSGTYGRPAAEILGAGKDSEASEAIVALVDRPDLRPVWFCVWGGSADLAQALWKVRQTRPSEEVQRFVRKIRVYLIGLQDGSGRWLLDNFADLLIIISERNYQGMFYNARGADASLSDLAWLNRHIRRGHGPLGEVYPQSGWNPKTPGVMEGDSPSFLHLVSAVRGVNDPEKPDQPGWGGRFVRRDPTRNHWTDDPAGPETVWRWRPQVQADFALRADWMNNR